jgi:hypothetical protein
MGDAPSGSRSTVESGQPYEQQLTETTACRELAGLA